MSRGIATEKTPKIWIGVGRVSRRFENNPVDPAVDGDPVAGGNRDAAGGDDRSAAAALRI